MITLLLSLLALAPNAEAKRGLSFTLDCQWNMSSRQPLGAPRYQVEKVPFKGADGKWDARFYLVVKPMNPTVPAEKFELVPAGDGDEDYSDYKLKDGQAHGIQGGAIQNKFQWASLTTTDGTSAYDCR